MIHTFNRSSLDDQAKASVKIDAAQLADDFCDYSKVVVTKPWGYEYLLFQNHYCAVWVLYLRPKALTSMHSHPVKTTSLIVVDGEAECSGLNSTLKLRSGEAVYIDKGVFHQTQATSSEGAYVIEIETPVNKRDLVRLKDAYGRTGQGYEDYHYHSKDLNNYNYINLDRSLEGLYNTRKRLGHCTLTFHRLQPGECEDLWSTFKPDDLIVVLSGAFQDQQNQNLYKTGEIFSVDALSSSNKWKLSAATDVLRVRKIDTLIKASDLVAQFIKQTPKAKTFAVVGDSNVHLVDSIAREEQLNFLTLNSEKNASLAAEAYSKMSSGPAFLLVSSGGSSVNALAGVANAWVDSTPLIVISGQSRSDQDTDNPKLRQLGNKSLCIVDMAKHITKYSTKILDPNKIISEMRLAVREAMSGRPGPVWLDIPIDVQGMLVDRSDQYTEPLAVAHDSDTELKSGNLKKQCHELLKLLQQSKRPVLLAGSGIRHAGAIEMFRTLVETLKLPVLMSRRGVDLLEDDNEYNFGRPGMYGQRRSNFVIQNADLLISVGSRLSIPLIGRNTDLFAKNATKVVVDIDEEELKKPTLKIDLPILSSADLFCKELLKELGSTSLPSYSDWNVRCQRWAHKFDPLAEAYAHRDAINPYLFFRQLSSVLPENTSVVVDGGACTVFAMQTFQLKKNQRMISSTGLELPGFVIPACLGISTWSHGRVVGVCENIGFQLGLSELPTFSKLGLPIKIFVLNSRGNLLIRKIQKDYFGGRLVNAETSLNYEELPEIKMASSCGFDVVRISKPAEMNDKLFASLESTKPTVIEVVLDSDIEFLPKMGFRVTEDGKWLAKPLEDMYPFLSSEDFKNEMTLGGSINEKNH